MYGDELQHKQHARSSAINPDSTTEIRINDAKQAPVESMVQALHGWEYLCHALSQPSLPSRCEHLRAFLLTEVRNPPEDP